MREIRTFELEEHDAVGWRVGQSQGIEVLEGQMWLTFECGSEDIWITAPGLIELPPGTRAWISGWRGPLRFHVSVLSRSTRLDWSFLAIKARSLHSLAFRLTRIMQG
jgi:hypothetical protein